MGLGALELMLHDAGNERRFVLFIPPLVALASIALGRREILPTTVERLPRGTGAPGRANRLPTPHTS